MAEHDPSSCHVCQRHAIGVGLEPQRKGEPPRYLCAQCLDILEYVHSVRRMDPYEVKAIALVDDLAGEFCGALEKTDMAEMSDEERRALWKCVVVGFGDSIRKLVREEMPF
ncbi:hypothetical protein LB559_09135 [Mesorhizobium sp. BR1-1-3]|uniref:hypothetical protein n=1 Tax=Mesorhizobium sp. BR1-1-3 TaxID=2876651 RepID=UPI001CD05F09|nr:hypothetical protein [Mesorhizobium sp. BR1-1-3]MBZ9888102.1 hypothetical protein [Mesorhizobium sp. BR1-1-3]